LPDVRLSAIVSKNIETIVLDSSLDRFVFKRKLAISSDVVIVIPYCGASSLLHWCCQSSQACGQLESNKFTVEFLVVHLSAIIKIFFEHVFHLN
jgi:hypothetical protein